MNHYSLFIFHDHLVSLLAFIMYVLSSSLSWMSGNGPANKRDARLSFDQVKVHIQQYLKRLEENIVPGGDRTALYLLFVNCFQVPNDPPHHILFTMNPPVLPVHPSPFISSPTSCFIHTTWFDALFCVCMCIWMSTYCIYVYIGYYTGSCLVMLDILDIRY